MRATHLLVNEFLSNHPAEAAAELERLPPAETAELLNELPPRLAAAALRFMTGDAAVEQLSSMQEGRATDVLADMPDEAAASVLLRMPPANREELLARLPEKAARPIRRRLTFPAQSAGALADSSVPTFAAESAAGETLSRLRRAARRAHYYVYVVDRDDRLVGVLNLRELMAAPPKQPLAEIMRREVARLPAAAEGEAVLEHPAWRDLHALPVVDHAGRFIGVVRHETVRRLELERHGRPDSESTGVGLALADLCWVGMTRLLGEIAGVAAGREKDAERR